MRDRSATLGLRYGPDSYGRQQWGILRNGGNPDAATPRAGRRPSGCKPLSAGNIVKVPAEEAPANYVPAAAVIRRERALSGFIGRKARVGGPSSGVSNPGAQPLAGPRTGGLECGRGRWGRRQVIMPLMPWAAHVLQWPVQRAATPRGGANPSKPAPVRIAGCNSPA